MIRKYLLVVLALLIGLVSASLVDRHLLGPRRDAARMVAEARPLASSTNAAQWIAAESLLAKAELLHREVAGLSELRTVIADKRAAASAEDEKILVQALGGCLAAIEKVGRTAEAATLRAEIGKALTRELHVRCMRVQLENLGAALGTVDAGATDAGATDASAPDGGSDATDSGAADAKLGG